MLSSQRAKAGLDGEGEGVQLTSAAASSSLSRAAAAAAASPPDAAAAGADMPIQQRRAPRPAAAAPSRRPPAAAAAASAAADAPAVASSALVEDWEGSSSSSSAAAAATAAAAAAEGPSAPAASAGVCGNWSRRSLLSLGAGAAALLVMFSLLARYGVLRLPPSAAAQPARAVSSGTLTAAAGLAASATVPPPPLSAVSVYTRSAQVPTAWRVVRRYAHDTNSFTQGLLWREAPRDGDGAGGAGAGASGPQPRGVNILYESKGMWARSGVRSMTLAAGAAPGELGSYALTADVAMDREGEFFGEGLCLWPAAAVTGAAGAGAGVLVQLTWQEQTGFLYSPDDLTQHGRFAYTTTGRNEGWGVTHDGRQLLVSDGSASLLFWNFSWAAGAPAAAAWAETRRITVTDASSTSGVASAPAPVAPGAPVRSLNELEYVHGWLLANIWQDNRIAVIDPGTGAAVAYLDLAALKAEQQPGADVLNGIAYTMTLGPTSPAADGVGAAPWGGRLWITGKQWQYLYEIELSALQTPTLPGRRRRGAAAKA